MDGRTIGRPFFALLRVHSDPLNWGKTRPATTVGLTLVLPTGNPCSSRCRWHCDWAKWNYGSHVKVKHDKYGPPEASYSHLSKIKVKKGQRIKQGTIVGLVGSTGRSTGPHLHYENEIEGKRVHPLKQDLPYMDPISNAQNAFMAHGTF